MWLAVFLYLNKRVDLKKRYKCEYAVVTGATGGVGTVLVSELVKQLKVIMIDRDEAAL